MILEAVTTAPNTAIRVYSRPHPSSDIPLWRYAGDDSLPIPITPADLIVCSALGQLDSRLGFNSHSIERFGDDRDGHRLYRAYFKGYHAPENAK